MAVIVAAILAGLGWWLFSSRAGREQEAKAFVREVATRLAFHSDRKILDVRLGREAQVRYPPSFRDRVIERLRGFGQPAGEVTIKGDVFFESYFFKPGGLLRAEVQYPAHHVYIDMTISHPQLWFQIDTLSVSWRPREGTPGAQDEDPAMQEPPLEQPAVPQPPPG